MIFQAIGAERIEALCDIFCADISKEKGVLLKPRFSPGYGDLSIEVQQDVFSVLNCGKKIGLYLNESMLMSPSKSVTAFAGIKKDNSCIKKAEKTNCAGCGKTDCVFRSL